MKYVAFLDILGFKQYMKKASHNEALSYMKSFSKVTKNIWSNSADSKYISGLIVSDSVVIYTNETSKAALDALLSLIKEICEYQFTRNSILLRGGITKGEFTDKSLESEGTLKEGLIVGQAYIDAYLLEGSAKVIGVVLSSEVTADAEEYGLGSYISRNDEKSLESVLSYVTPDFLLNLKNLTNFVDAGMKSKWLPHYYNTLYFAFRREKNKEKVNQIFYDILQQLQLSKNGWSKVDEFIENSFQTDVSYFYKVRFKSFLRSNLSLSDEQDV